MDATFHAKQRNLQFQKKTNPQYDALTLRSHTVEQFSMFIDIISSSVRNLMLPVAKLRPSEAKHSPVTESP